MKSHSEPRQTDPHQHERYPLADDFFKQETVELVLELSEQFATSRREGKIPDMTTLDLTFAADLTDDMDVDYKQRLIDHQHKLLIEALHNQKLRDKKIEPHLPVNVDWKSQDGDSLKTVFIRLNKDMALTENTYLGDDGVPVRYRPMVWTGKDALNDFVKMYMEAEEFQSAHVY